MICTRCIEDKPVDEFSFQKTKPMFRYAWCDPCRKEANSSIEYASTKNIRALKQDYKQMRQKAESLRKFSPDQCKSIKTRVENGERVVDLSLEYKVSGSTIRRAMRNYA